jgi:1-propanol dehydrogenase
MKPVIYTGGDCLERLAQFKGERIYLVCDPFLVGTDALKGVVGDLEKENDLQIFSDLVPDPPVEVVAQGFELMAQFSPTVLLAFGGGSAIDAAKAMLFVKLSLHHEGVQRFIAIPTTSGTGSEVTSASVITDRLSKIKYPIFDKRLIPDEALLDAALVMSSPKTVTAFSGLDVLTHALEALVARQGTSYTEALAEKAIHLVFTYLLECFQHGDNLAARIKMHQASCLAGMAFEAAGLGINHALAHQLGGQFKVPHGLANAMLLPHVIAFNAKEQRSCEKYASIAIQLGLGNQHLSPQLLLMKLQKAIIQLAQQLDCPLSLAEYGVSKSEALSKAEIIAENALNDATYAFNPRQATKSELITIYKAII